MDNKAVIKRSVIELQRNFGNIIPIEEIITANVEVEKEDVIKALDDLKQEGLINVLDEDSIQVNF